MASAAPRESGVRLLDHRDGVVGIRCGGSDLVLSHRAIQRDCDGHDLRHTVDGAG